MIFVDYRVILNVMQIVPVIMLNTPPFVHKMVAERSFPLVTQVVRVKKSFRMVKK